VSSRNRLGGFAAHRTCCAVKKYRENRCSVIFPNKAGTWIALSGTAYQTTHRYRQKLCDILFGWSQLTGGIASAAIELKGGGFDVSGVIKQLQNGANLADSLLDGLTCNFIPVLVHQGMPTMSMTQLRNTSIRFRNENYLILIIKARAEVTKFVWLSPLATVANRRGSSPPFPEA
jgi:hypothetical protein